MVLFNGAKPILNWARYAFVMLGIGLSFATSASAETSSPFNTLLGSWGGSGLIRLQDGTTERLRCNAYYTGGGSALGIAIRCTSDTQKVEIRSKLSYANGRLSGHWEERTFNAEGDITGTASDGRLKFSITGSVGGSMDVQFDKSIQNVTILTEGIALKSVKVKLGKQ